MKVLLAADIFPPERGGPATYVVALAQALTDRDHDVRIVSLNPDSDTDAAHVPVHPARARNKLLRYVSYTWLLIRHARQADCMYAMGPVNAGLPTWIASLLSRTPYVVKVVGDYAWEQGTIRAAVTDTIDAFQKKHQYPRLVRWLKRAQSFVVRRATRVIVPSNYLASIVRGWGAADDRVSVIYNAVEITDVEPQEKPADTFRIVVVARLVPWKGIDTLIHALKNIEHRNIEVCIIGDGPDRTRLEQLCADHKYMQLLGAQPLPVTRGYIVSAGLLVLLSAYEGLSHVILEALQLDTPVLASDCCGNPELIQEGRNGRLVPYGDVDAAAAALQSMITQPIDIAVWKQTTDAQVLFQQTTFEHMVTHTESLLEDL